MAKISKKTALLWIFVVAAVAALWRFVWEPMGQKEETRQGESATVVTPVQTNPAPANSAPEAMPAETVTERSVRTRYKNPGGEDEVGFTLGIDEDGVIQTAKVEVLAKNPTSQKRQVAFAEGLPAAIQGKKLSELTAIDKVGGSSLTTDSFNASLEELKKAL